MASSSASRGSLQRRWRRLVRYAVLPAVLLVPLVMAAPARSTNFGGCATANQPCLANNSTHWFSYNLNASNKRWRGAVEFTRVNSYETTALTTGLTSHEASDVYYYLDNTDRGAFGQYYCLYPEAGRPGVCHHAHIWFNDSNTGIYALTQDQRISVACHETGHSVGLRHPLSDHPVYQCMNRLLRPAGFPMFLGGHNAGHIDDYYS